MRKRTVTTFFSFFVCLKQHYLLLLSCAFSMVASTLMSPLRPQAFLCTLLYIEWPLQLIAPKLPAWQEFSWTHFDICCCQNYSAVLTTLCCYYRVLHSSKRLFGQS